VPPPRLPVATSRKTGPEDLGVHRGSTAPAGAHTAPLRGPILRSAAKGSRFCGAPRPRRQSVAPGVWCHARADRLGRRPPASRALDVERQRLRPYDGMLYEVVLPRSRGRIRKRGSGCCAEAIIVLLVQVWAGVIQCRVEADPVVPAFNEREDGCTGGLTCWPDVGIDQLFFQGCKE
jgi:hypothetical protein